MPTSQNLYYPVIKYSFPSFLPISLSPYLSKGKPTYTRLKALGGIIFNLAIAIIFTGYSHNPLAQAVIVANLLIAVTSLSDLEAMVTGVAGFYCGNFGLISLRKPMLLPLVETAPSELETHWHEWMPRNRAVTSGIQPLESFVKSGTISILVQPPQNRKWDACERRRGASIYRQRMDLRN